MALLFALRCLVPLVLMFGIGYAMNWLVDKWEREASLTKMMGTGLGTAALQIATDGCWSFKQCDPEVRENCPGFKQQKLPCWLARTQAEGTLPEECISCPLYDVTPSLA